MPIGVIINAVVIILGGLFGSFAGKIIPDELKKNLTLIFGICALGMGVSAVGYMTYMPAVIFAVVIGTIIGLVVNMGALVHKGAAMMEKPVAKVFENYKSDLPHEEYMTSLVTIIVIFCAGSTGIYGAIIAGMTGDNSILISKCILDFFTASIFASQLGPVVSMISIPQTVILTLLALAAKSIYPLTTIDMINDFKACGGILMMATGLRMTGIKSFPIADMIPAMVLVMPFSAFWVNVIMPLLSQ